MSRECGHNPVTAVKIPDISGINSWPGIEEHAFTRVELLSGEAEQIENLYRCTGIQVLARNDIRHVEICRYPDRLLLLKRHPQHG